MNNVRQEPWTVERFLSWEDKQEEKHEFDGVRIIPMTGPTSAHQRMVFNLMIALPERIDRTAFDATHGMRLNTGSQLRYPDVTVCPGRIPGRTRTLQNATIVFAVLSEETEATDRAEKPSDYARLPSIRHYVLLEQALKAATVLDFIGSQRRKADVTNGAIALPRIGIDLPLNAIYRNLRL